MPASARRCVKPLARSRPVDEPDQPAASWGEVTYREMAARARSLAVALDRLGVGHGERVAIVSHNSARLLTALRMVHHIVP